MKIHQMVRPIVSNSKQILKDELPSQNEAPTEASLHAPKVLPKKMIQRASNASKSTLKVCLPTMNLRLTQC